MFSRPGVYDAGVKVAVHRSSEDLYLYVARELDVEYEEAKRLCENAERVPLSD